MYAGMQQTASQPAYYSHPPRGLVPLGSYPRTVLSKKGTADVDGRSVCVCVCVCVCVRTRACTCRPRRAWSGAVAAVTPQQGTPPGERLLSPTASGVASGGRATVTNPFLTTFPSPPYPPFLCPCPCHPWSPPYRAEAV
jgi:hypothetical protein